MTKFSFGKRSHEEVEVPPEPIEGEVEVPPQEPRDSGGRRVGRPLILAGIGAVLIGGLYVANILFLSPPPAPTPQPLPQKAVPVPAVPETKAPSPAKEVAPGAPAASSSIAPSIPAVKPPQQPPSIPVKPTIPATAPPVAGPPKKPESPAKPSAPQAAPAKATAPPIKAEATPAAKGAAASGSFSIQVGAMAMEENAQSLKQKLDALGFSAVIRKGTGYANRHIVTAGEPGGKREAEDLARRLNVDGFPSQIVSFEGKFTPQIGTFVNLDEAIDLARDLQKKGYRPKITSKPSTAVLYQVRTGKFDTRAEAVKRGEELKAKGFNAWVVPN